MSHTPGPWEVGRVDGQQVGIDAPGGDPKIRYASWETLAVVYGCDDDKSVGREVMFSNARLIAAAPDLLEALKRIASIEDKYTGSDWDEIEEAREIANAAIAKAEGK